MKTATEGSSTGELQCLGRSESTSPHRFPEAAWILLTKAHVVNSRLAGCEILECVRADSQESIPVTPSLPDFEASELRVRRRLIPKDPDSFVPVFEECTLSQRELRIRTLSLLPKSPKQDAKEVEAVAPPMEMVIRLDDDNQVSLLSSSQSKWLLEVVFPRFVRWMNVSTPSGTQTSQLQINSLGLVNIETYSRVYSRLKKLYGKKLVQIWTEKTDPLKFVYEDIAIASYLIALWDPNLEGVKTSFVDVGCGNGLLVYILVLEGHRGLGVDVRRRAIWDLYPEEVRVCLREEPVTPESRFDHEWWIGNHSDELTPWIPLLATLSNPAAKVFLLPCCPFGLFGKFQRTSPTLSQYQSYLTYLKDDFLVQCGFQVEVDKMRIPSTKRVCFVARARTSESHSEVVGRLQKMLTAEQTFVPREKEIKVKNCSQIDRDLVTRLVNRIADALLQKSEGSQDGYNVGGVLSLPEAVGLVRADELTRLKAQCGGVQTLLKNNYHVFKVLQGKVKLRIPEALRSEQADAQSTEATSTSRRRPCWFFTNHPQQCPLTASQCRFAHSVTDQ